MPRGARTPLRRPAARTLILVVMGACVLLAGGRALVGSPQVRGFAWRLVHGAPDPILPGHWNPVQARDGPVDPEQRRRIRALESLGYTGAGMASHGESGVTIHDPAHASSGPRFFISGHAPEAILMEPDGRILHTWRHDYRSLHEARPDDFPPPSNVTGCWRRARLMPDGSVLAIYEGHGLVKLDRDSNLLWAYDDQCHHDLDLMDDGTILVLTREATVVPRFHPEEPVLLDSVTMLTPDGEPLGRLDLLAAFEHSPFARLLPEPPASGDLFHTNTLELLDGRLGWRSEAFRAGNLLISVREMDVVATVDPRFGRVVWARQGSWTRQHEPTVVEDARLLLFDNQGVDGRSRVMEFDPFTLETVWQYADGPDTPLFSGTCGAARRLPNGHTLIVETDNGRALEVTPDGEIVWEYRNPYRAGKEGVLIAAILDMEILPDDAPLDWLTPPDRLSMQ